uniref:WLM domain-containing protein n=1 Tax=viral metagenome TaxID=1070528 RepID=A0A6C0FA78_9ZZZZ|tara:strand:+ start:14780 stop:15385 length:606 start_codon:yes stop_codon:yes gene_type:complete
MLDYLAKQDLLFYVIFAFVIVYCLKIYSESEVFNLKCIVSDVDGHKYCVRNRVKIDEAADLLAQTTNKAKRFVNELYKKYPNKDNVKRLKEGFNPRKVQETLPTSELTAYSENKGEKLAFCLSKTKHSEKLIDPNTLMFVCLHELAHVASVSIGHKKEFWDNFKFLLVEAKEMGYYNPIDYKKNNENYCGMTITDNPYYDM